jgi:tRNA threonylcarbamoyladenosine biosynthesis protein TsaE
MTVTALSEAAVLSRSPEETVELARKLAEAHPEGGVFYLDGDLGAGKTLFAKGIAAQYGIDPDRVVSPTFALVNRYSEGSVTVYHVDLYRIETERELAELGLEEIEEEKGVVLIVEWPEKLGRYRRSDAIWVHLETLESDSRQIQIIEPPGEIQ